MDFSLLTGEAVLLGLALIASGLLAGFLAGLFGIGGGAVLVPVLYQFLAFLNVDESVRMHVAVATSLAIIVPTSARSFLAHKKRGAADLQLLKTWLVPLPLGVIGAALVAAYVSGTGLKVIFAVIALVLGLRMLLDQPHWRLGTDIPGNPIRAVCGFLIGFFSTLMGIGGGVMNNTFMTLYGRPIHQAVATSSGTGLMISIPGTIGLIWAGWGAAGLPAFSAGYVNLLGVALIIPVTTFAAPFGVKAAHALSRRTMEVCFGIFLILVALRFFTSAFG